MARKVLLTGIYDCLEEQKINNGNFIQQYLVEELSGGIRYKILDIFCEIDGDNKIKQTLTKTKEIEIDSAFFDSYFNALINVLRDKKSELIKKYAEVCFDYITLDINDEGLNYCETSATLVD